MLIKAHFHLIFKNELFGKVEYMNIIKKLFKTPPATRKLNTKAKDLIFSDRKEISENISVESGGKEERREGASEVSSP